MRGLTVSAVFLLLAGCISYPETEQSGVDQNLITRQEIMDSGVTNLYEGVMRLRPRWVRPGTPVYMDGVSIGDIEALRDWPNDTAITLEWMDPMQALQRVPGLSALPSDISGVIVVRTRVP